MSTETQIAGVAFLNNEGQAVFSTGLGSDPRIRALTTDRAWMGELREVRLTTLTLDRHTYAILLAATESGELLVIRRAPGDALLHSSEAVSFAWTSYSIWLTVPSTP